MKNLHEYNKFIQNLESCCPTGLFYSRVNEHILVTDDSHRLMGIWDISGGQAIQSINLVP